MEHAMALVEQIDITVRKAAAMHHAVLSTLHDCMSVLVGRYAVHGAKPNQC